MTVLPRIPDHELDDLGPDGRHFGGLRSERGHLPLVAMAVACDVTGLFVTTRVRQTFVNLLDEPIEATYVFPLPDRAAVAAFTAVLGDRRIVGLLKERQEARDDYDAAIAAGQRAAIVEEDRPGVFTARVGNLRPGERGEVELTLVGPLPYDAGVATLRFPLVVAPRYIPGIPLGQPSAGDGVAADTDLVPDASRISPPTLLPGHPNPVRLELAATIDPAGFALSDLRSSLHTVRTERAGVSSVRVELRPGERLDRDFILRFTLAGAGAETSALAVPDHPGASEGTVAVTIVPPRPGPTSRRRDVAVVIDRSGSMAGWKMVAARRAAARIVDGLGAGDRMAVLGFDDRIDRPARLATGLVAASDRHRFAAVEFLAGLEARGGTEMHLPLAEAAALLAADRSDRDRVLVLVTDGQVGQEDVALAALAPHLDAVRVFTLGIDQAVNAGFLQRLAAMSGGRCELVESEDRLDEAMTAIHRQIAVPVVAGLTMDLAGAELAPATQAPARPPDCTEGTPCVLAGRYRGAGAGPIVVRIGGTVADGTPWSDTVEAAVVENPAVTATWARAHIRDLEDRYAATLGRPPGTASTLGRPPGAAAAGGVNEEALASAIVEVSLAHGVLSRFTAFVAVEPTRPDEPAATPHRIVQPVEMPAAWAAAPAAMPLAAGGVARRMASSPYAPASAPPPTGMASPPPPATRPAVWEEVEALLRRVERGGVDAGEIDRLVDDLRTAGAPDTVTDAVAALAAGVRRWVSADELSQLVKAVRALRPGRRRFWKAG
jgi:Ca-activated chloride channel homolog